jgi:replication fork protection complex subunit Csm3/Swi3
MYQLWLDDLFPKARFLDAAAMVEKLGHKKRIQVMRNQWIDEGRPRQSVFEESLFDEPSLPRREDGIANGREERMAPIFEKMRASELPPARPRTPVGEPFDDLFDATPVARRMERPAEADDVPPANDSIFGNGTGSIFGGPAARKVDEADFADDLDALLAEAELDGAAAPALGKDTGPPPPEPDFDDDEEAMAEMGW